MESTNSSLAIRVDVLYDHQNKNWLGRASITTADTEGEYVVHSTGQSRYHVTNMLVKSLDKVVQDQYWTD